MWLFPSGRFEELLTEKQARGWQLTLITSRTFTKIFLVVSRKCEKNLFFVLLFHLRLKNVLLFSRNKKSFLRYETITMFKKFVFNLGHQEVFWIGSKYSCNGYMKSSCVFLWKGSCVPRCLEDISMTIERNKVVFFWARCLDAGDFDESILLINILI